MSNIDPPTRPAATRVIARLPSSHFGFWLAALVLVILTLTLLREVLLPFVVAMAIAYFLNPLADALERRGLSRNLAAGLIVAAFIVALLLALVLLAPMLLAQGKQLVASLPVYVEQLRAAVLEFGKTRLGEHYPALQAALEQASDQFKAGLTGSMASVLTALWNRGVAVINVTSLLIITPMVVFYLLADWNRMLEKARSWLPRDHAATIEHLAGDMNQAVAAFARGQGTICLALALFYGLGLSLVGLKYGLIVGLATGLAGFVPVVGWALGSLVALTLALAQYGFALGPILMVIGVLVAGSALETAVLAPHLVGEKIGLHPVWLIFALFAFSYLFGFIGTIIAVPLAAAVAVLLRYGLKLYLASDIYRGNAEASR